MMCNVWSKVCMRMRVYMQGARAYCNCVRFVHPNSWLPVCARKAYTYACVRGDESLLQLCTLCPSELMISRCVRKVFPESLFHVQVMSSKMYGTGMSLWTHVSEVKTQEHTKRSKPSTPANRRSMHEMSCFDSRMWTNRRAWKLWSVYLQEYFYRPQTVPCKIGNVIHRLQNKQHFLEAGARSLMTIGAGAAVYRRI